MDGVSNVKLSRGGSVLLDVLRFSAACTVLLSHFTHPTISSGFPSFATAGHLAVAVFFVLSGFVVRYVTLTREASAGQYLIDRVSRIYSVVAPALLVTVLCEFLATHFPRYYALGGHPVPWRDVAFQIAANLTFQAQDWGYEIRPLSNAPFWSLSFECFYYAIYGLVFYRVHGWKFLCFLLLLVGGPSIALMFLVWLLGCFAFDAYLKLRAGKMGIYICSGIFAAMLLMLFSVRVRLHDLLVAADEAHRTEFLSQLLHRLPHHEIVLAGGRVPWLDNASPSFFVVGFATAISTVWSLLLIDRFKMDVASSVTRWIRFLADSTFALYLLHLPMLILTESIAGKPIKSRWTSAIILCLIVCSCVLLAIPMDALKRKMRLLMERSRQQSGHDPLNLSAHNFQDERLQVGSTR